MNIEIKFKGWNSIVGRMSDPMNLNEIYEKKGVQWHIIDWLQYTGLKDRKGVEIYKGDIIQFYWLKEIVGVIELNKYGHSCIKVKEQEYHIENTFNGTVIGNIHENPELLKE